MDFLNIKIKDKNYLYKKGTTIEEISKQFNINYKYPILISYVDNRLCFILCRLYFKNWVKNIS